MMFFVAACTTCGGQPGVERCSYTGQVHIECFNCQDADYEPGVGFYNTNPVARAKTFLDAVEEWNQEAYEAC